MTPVEGMPEAQHQVGRGNEAIQNAVHDVDQPDRQSQSKVAAWHQFHMIRPRQRLLPQHGHQRRIQTQHIEPEPPRDSGCGRGRDGGGWHGARIVVFCGGGVQKIDVR